MRLTTFLTLLMSVLSTNALASAGLNIVCFEDNEGAKITLNGVDKGSCPTRIFIPEGQYTLRAVKAVDAQQERVFEQTLKMGSGEVARVEIQLSAPQLTKAAIASKKAAEMAQKAKEAEADIAQAEQGSLEAMQRLVQRYRSADGVKKDEAKAAQWEKRATSLQQEQQKAYAENTLAEAEHGDLFSMKEMVTLYRTGQGIEANEAEAQRWQQKATQLELKQQQEEAVQAQLENYWDWENTMVFKGFFFMGDSIDTENIMMFTTSLPFILISSSTGLLFDIFYQPSRTTTYFNLKKQAQINAAAWHEPDSLMGQVKAEQVASQ